MGILVQKITNRPCTTAPPPDKSNVNDDEIFDEDEEKVGYSAARLNAAIADLVHAQGLTFDLTETACFHRVIRLAKFAPPNYKPPKRKLAAGRLLTANHDDYMRRMYDQLALQAYTYGLCLPGDGSTVKHMPLVNVLAAGVHEPAGVLEIAECTGHIESGDKKDARFIDDIFLKHMAKIDPTKKLIDCVFFDGASSVKKAGAILRVTYPRATALHGAEDVATLFFKDISKLAPIKYQFSVIVLCIACLDQALCTGPMPFLRNTQDPSTAAVTLVYCVLLTRVWWGASWQCIVIFVLKAPCMILLRGATSFLSR
jgi:hypothetical protein